MKASIPIIIILFFFTNSLLGQSAFVQGIVKDESGNPIENVAVTYNQTGSVTNSEGVYSLEVPSGKFINITFSHVSFNTLIKRIRIPRNRTLNFSPKLIAKTEEIEEVIVKDNKEKVQGIEKVPIETIKNLPSANAGIE
ncbi:MAG: carboxypeptidase-like regulatory domain-containing protein, partial [Aureibaculum sp.]